MYKVTSISGLTFYWGRGWVYEKYRSDVFLSKIDLRVTPNEFPADLVTFTGEILNGKLHFLCREHSELAIILSKGIKTISM